MSAESDHDGDLGFDEPPFEEVDPEKLAECLYWRCALLFERRTSNHVYCRKACRSRDKKWRRSVERKEARAAKRALKKQSR